MITWDETIRQLHMISNLSQYQLSRRTGIRGDKVCRFENDDTKPSAEERKMVGGSRDLLLLCHGPQHEFSSLPSTTFVVAERHSQWLISCHGRRPALKWGTPFSPQAFEDASTFHKCGIASDMSGELRPVRTCNLAIALWVRLTVPKFEWGRTCRS